MVDVKLESEGVLTVKCLEEVVLIGRLCKELNRLAVAATVVGGYGGIADVVWLELLHEVVLMTIRVGTLNDTRVEVVKNLDRRDWHCSVCLDLLRCSSHFLHRTCVFMVMLVENVQLVDSTCKGNRCLLPQLQSA